jgi:dipeptidyl aminopeptidase/acylaminoacyl peptidase
MSFRGGGLDVYQRATSGVTQNEILDKDARIKYPMDWSRDGRYIVEEVQDPKTGADIWLLPLFGDRKAFPYLHSEFNESFAKLSPNGQWLAYVSDESKRNEVYVRTFPNPGGKWQVSTNGGSFPVWSRNEKELYFLGGDNKLMAVELKGGDNFDRGPPKPLFDARIAADTAFDVSRDGRFLIPIIAEQAGIAPIQVVINWAVELKKF